jgi:hypothetical protein
VLEVLTRQMGCRLFLYPFRNGDAVGSVKLDLECLPADHAFECRDLRLIFLKKISSCGSLSNAPAFSSFLTQNQQTKQGGFPTKQGWLFGKSKVIINSS